MEGFQLEAERSVQLEELEGRIGYRFQNRALLDHALTHKSFAYERFQSRERPVSSCAQDLCDNESLEFLGDSVLGFLISAQLFALYPHFSEGKLSKMKAFLVSSSALSKRAAALELGKYLRLGYGEEKSGGREKRALLVDAYEALIAAIYLDGGIEKAAEFVRREFAPMLDEINAGGLIYTDYKSALQERLHLLKLPEPRYRVAAEIGPDHRKTFLVEVLINDKVVAKGGGRTKKEAQQEAARIALQVLERQKEGDENGTSANA